MPRCNPACVDPGLRPWRHDVIDAIVGQRFLVLRDHLGDVCSKLKDVGFGDPIHAKVAKATGIHRTTLSKIANKKGYKRTTDNLDKLCEFFGCPIEEIAEYLPKEQDAGT
jgi:DNA-binding Xre family transcriptional regulator